MATADLWVARHGGAHGGFAAHFAALDLDTLDALTEASAGWSPAS